MSDNERCEVCRFCKVEAGEKVGLCRRDTPRMTGSVANPHQCSGEWYWAVWPSVNLKADWCGEFQPRKETA